MCLWDQLRARYARWHQKGVSRTCNRGLQNKNVSLLSVPSLCYSHNGRKRKQKLYSTGRHTPTTDHWPHPNPWKPPQKNPGIIRCVWDIYLSGWNVSLFLCSGIKTRCGWFVKSSGSDRPELRAGKPLTDAGAIWTQTEDRTSDPPRWRQRELPDRQHPVREFQNKTAIWQRAAAVLTPWWFKSHLSAFVHQLKLYTS